MFDAKEEEIKDIYDLFPKKDINNLWEAGKKALEINWLLPL